jgi:hypothetical protein
MGVDGMKLETTPCAVAMLLLILLHAGTTLAQGGTNETSDTPESGAVDYARSGPYVWLGTGIGITTKAEGELTSIVSALASFPVPVEVSSSVGFNGRLGFAGEIFSSELQFEYLPSFEASVLGITAAEWSMFTMTANARVQAPLGRVQPYALLGGGFTRSAMSARFSSVADTSFYGGALRAGGGLNLYLTEHVAFGGDVTYVVPFGDNDELDYVSIGLGLFYKF